MKALLLCLALIAASDGLASPAGVAQQPPPGFVITADHRYDPAIQRLLAERSLKALPIRGGRLFYIVPQDSNRMIEAMQIRYIEELLYRRNVEPKLE